jgi:hypothetical protein
MTLVERLRRTALFASALLIIAMICVDREGRRSCGIMGDGCGGLLAGDRGPSLPPLCP